MARWSKLQSALYRIIDPAVGFQMHCVAYPVRPSKGYGENKIPRFWIAIHDKIIWDVPRMFPKDEDWYVECFPTQLKYDISSCLRRYIDCPRDELMQFGQDNDMFGLVPILKACDRRISVEKRRKIIQEAGLDISFSNQKHSDR